MSFHISIYVVYAPQRKTAMKGNPRLPAYRSVLQRVAACCSVLQQLAVLPAVGGSC